MMEQEAKTMTNEIVMKMLTAKSKGWGEALKRIFEMAKSNTELIMAYGPVYNGGVPSFGSGKLKELYSVYPPYSLS